MDDSRETTTEVARRVIGIRRLKEPMPKTYPNKDIHRCKPEGRGWKDNFRS